MDQDELVTTKRELNAALLTVTKLLKDISQLNEKIKSLESMLANKTALFVPKAEKSALVPHTIKTEELIADMQLERIKVAATERTLTLEETRMYDLFVKNKRLSQETPDEAAKKGAYREVSDIELLKIASEAKPDGSNS